MANPVLAVVLYLLLVDLAVETHLYGPAISWWVMAPVGVYLAASAAVWRRIGWATRSFLSSVVLAGLLAVTVWLPHGLDRGVRLLGQSTPVLLSALSLLVVMYAVALVVRFVVLPRWARWPAAIVGFYGLVAFGSAAATGSSYGTLFHGSGFWPGLPNWLGGAGLAPLIVIPAGLSVLAWRFAKARRSTNGVTSTALRMNLLAALPLLALLSFFGAGVTAPQITELWISVDPAGSDRISEVPAFARSIFAGWEVVGIDSGTTVEGRWVRLTGNHDDGGAAGSGFVETINDDTSMVSALSAADAGWRAGRYRLDLQVANRAVRSIAFVVRPPETRVVLAAAVDSAGQPVDPGREFGDDTETIYAVVESELPSASAFQAIWTAVDTEDSQPNRRLDRARFYVSPGAQEVVSLEAERSGFFPGEYRLDVEAIGGPRVSVPFRVEPIFPIAELVEETEAPRGPNVALAAQGGAIARVTSEGEENLWRASNLIDGAPMRVEVDGTDCLSCGWTTGGDSLPQEIVFSFLGGRAPRISAVVLDPTTAETIERPEWIPRHVELLASRSSSTDGFERVTGARIRQVLGDQIIRFSPVRASYLKLRLLSNYGGRRTQLGEVKVIEDAGDEPSILQGHDRNLALPALGGSVVTYTSQHDEASGVHRLIDGRADAPGWRSADESLPQTFVLALAGSEHPRLDEIIVRPAPDHEAETRPALMSVSVSTDGPLEGFEELPPVILSREARAVSLDVRRPARFVKISVLENHGGDYTALGEVELLQTMETRAGGRPRDDESPAAGAGPDQPVARLLADTIEVEPNDRPDQADHLSLDEVIEGVIEAPEQEDYFRLTIPGIEPSVLTLDLAGLPNVRTSVDLVDESGTVLERFDPADVAADSAAFSWVVSPGVWFLRVSQPPSSVVLIWDASGSMEGKSDDLRRAVEAYISQARPSERVNLIRFSTEVDVLLPSFTSDREELRAATENQFVPDGATALFDALAEGMSLLRGEPGNKAIVVMTDGNDTASRLELPAFWDRLEGAGVRLYTIGLGAWLRAYVPRHGSSGEQLLGHMAQGTNGRFLFARDSDQLGSAYEMIARELRSASTYYLKPSLAAGTGRVRVIATKERIPKQLTAPPQVELIFDASGSMREQDNLVDGRLKIDVAKDVVERIVTDLPDSIRVGLRVYGHRIAEGRPGDCEDSELVYPFGPLDRDRLISRVREIVARAGTTPIAYSLRQVSDDFGDARGEKIVILVTDGKEECGGDVAEAASALLDQGLEVRVNVVGFALAEEAVKEEMERVAEITRGRFYDAQDSEALLGAIEKSLATPYDLLTADSTVVASGLVGQEPAEVPVGVYTVVVHAAGSPITIPGVRVRLDRSTTIELRKEGQKVGVVRRGYE